MADVGTQDVLVPDIGDFTDVPVIEILVSEGAEVAPEDPLIVLESDKATMEVPSPAAGTVGAIAVSAGDTVSEGDLILTLTVSDDDESAAQGDKSEQAADAAVPTSAEGTDATSTEATTPSERGEPDAGARPGPSAPAGEPADGEPAGAGADQEPPYAGPAARKLARELGVDLGAVDGSGRKGRITKEDVQAAAEGPAAAGAPPVRGAQAPAAGARADLPPWPDVDFAAYGEIETVELSRIKRIAGPALSRNWALIPHVTQHDEADITELEEFRKEINAAHAQDGVKVTMVSLLLKACASALRAYPEFNASIAGDSLVLKRYYHLGFAVDTPGGLLVPVIRDVDRKGLLEIAGELRELSGAAREGKISAEQMRGGTFTVSSLGGIGGTAFTPIVNAPEVAILGVSRSETKPVWDGERFVPRLMLPLSLSYDHRVVDGAAAARFTTHLGTLLSDARRMLL